MGGQTPDALDQSWGYADPATCARLGITYVSMYLSWDKSKNITAAKVRAYHAHGVAVGANWESLAGAPRNGAAQGRADATEAVRQLRALIAGVGYAPKSPLAIVFSCDTDITSAQFPQIDAYYRAAREIVHAAGFLLGVYGEADLVDHLSRAGITDVEWQASAWSRGRISTAADLYQYLNGQKLGGASVDFDRVIHPAQLGAWWPPGHPGDTATNGDEPVTPAEIKLIAEAVHDRLLKAGDIPAPADSASIKTHPFWNWQSHIVATTTGVRAIGKVVGSILTRVAALQASVDALRDEIRSSGAVDIEPQSVPIVGTLTIGGSK